MAKTLKINDIGELIGEKPYHLNWFSYSLDSWGAKLAKKARSSRRNIGAVVQGIDKDTSIQKVIKDANNGNFDEIAGFYPAILMFFGEKFIEKVDFCDKSGRNRISRLIDNLKGPTHLKDKIYDFIKQDFDFLAFIEACGRNEKLNFDVNSAISAYKLQGDAIIYPLLCQMFYVNKGINRLNIDLIDDVPIDFPIKISDYVSGCTFPVAVSPKISDTKWENNANGHFLYGKLGDEWLVMDVMAVGRMNLSNYALTNRINFLGGGGKCLPYVICWNWGEIIEAYNYFKSELLIRDLKNTIFNHYWFNFGPNSLINVEFQNNIINYESNYEIIPDLNFDVPTGKKQYITVKLNGNFVQYCEKNDVCYSKSEVFDWFELISMLK